MSVWSVCGCSAASVTQLFCQVQLHALFWSAAPYGSRGESGRAKRAASPGPALAPVWSGPRVCVCVYVCVGMCVCVCVIQGWIEGLLRRGGRAYVCVCVCVYVCVCVCERERDGE